MKSLSTFFAVFAILLGVGSASAAESVLVTLATVEQVQAPAWRQRDSEVRPLAPGMELRSGDQVRTGADARVYLRLAEGSRVKLGENASFAMHSRSLAPQRLFKGALDVLAGAFRFTTGALARVRGQRELQIRVATATIGIRGTDVWGKATQERDLVALIEGQIELSRNGIAVPIAPMQYLDAAKGGEAEVRLLDAATLARIARETEIERGDGAMQVLRSGKSSAPWLVSLARAESSNAALALFDHAREAGYAATIRPISQDNAWLYDVLLRGFASADDARLAAERLQRDTGLIPRVILLSD